MERTPEQVKLHDNLMSETLKKRQIKLTDLQKIKFDVACWKAIDENEDLSFREYLIVTNIFLNFIIQFPDLNF
jgi:hypothetical protein